jgi:DNA polymerase-1
MSAALGSLQQKVIDVMALTGDTVDNVPGAPGIGAKTAAKLINRWGSLDALILSAITGYSDHDLTPRLGKILRDNLQQVLMSRELVRLDRGAST